LLYWHALIRFIDNSVEAYFLGATLYSGAGST